eukprot:6175257-Pleurochrysis_carterae.AAC.3
MARHNMPTAYAMPGRRGCDDEREVGAGRRVVALERRGHALGQIGVDTLRDGFRGVVRVEDEEVVDVTPDDDRLRHAADGFGTREDAGVGGTLLETPGLELGEQGPLPATSCLGHSVHRLEYAA